MGSGRCATLFRPFPPPTRTRAGLARSLPLQPANGDHSTKCTLIRSFEGTASNLPVRTRRSRLSYPHVLKPFPERGRAAKPGIGGSRPKRTVQGSPQDGLFCRAQRSADWCRRSRLVQSEMYWTIRLDQSGKGFDHLQVGKLLGTPVVDASGALARGLSQRTPVRWWKHTAGRLRLNCAPCAGVRRRGDGRTPKPGENPTRDWVCPAGKGRRDVALHEAHAIFARGVRPQSF